jgi:hypothetical protein
VVNLSSLAKGSVAPLRPKSWKLAEIPFEEVGMLEPNDPRKRAMRKVPTCLAGTHRRPPKPTGADDPQASQYLQSLGSDLRESASIAVVVGGVELAPTGSGPGSGPPFLFQTVESGGCLRQIAGGKIDRLRHPTSPPL